jgi:YD repeat-containing protein
LRNTKKPDYIQPSPNAASLGAFGEIPVSHFTGIPNISIPIYTLTEGTISVPINLSYYASGVRLDQHPGWVGQNWSLNAGGVITRKVKDLPDDYNNPNKTIEITQDIPDKEFILALTTTTHNGDRRGYYYKHSLISDYSRSNVINYVNSNLQVNDTEPDEYVFNFCGYTGKFFLSENGNWEVQAEGNIRVSLNGFTRVPDVLSGQNHSITWENIGGYHISTFKGFTLTTDDGTKYVFGANIDEENTDAIEYSVPFNEQHKTEWSASSWYLKSITSPTGHVISFTYEPDDYISEMGVSFKYIAIDPACYYLEDDPRYKSYEMWVNDQLRVEWQEAVSKVGEECMEQCKLPPQILKACVDENGVIFDPCKLVESMEYYEYTNSFLSPKYASYSGTLIRPVYLSKIESRNIGIDFLRENTNELRFDKEIYTRAWRKKDNIHNIQQYFDFLLEVQATLQDPWEVLSFYWGGMFGLRERTTIWDLVSDLEFTMQDKILLDYYQYWPYLYEAAGDVDDIDAMLNKMQWKKLNSVKMYDKLNAEEYYEYNLDYVDIPSKRLFLSAIDKTSSNGDKINMYSFSYYSESLPGYCAERVDHWGFYNARASFLTMPRTSEFHNALLNQVTINSPETRTGYYQTREPRDLSTSQIGSLKEIKYPTGGKTEFVYEMNDYSKYVNDELLLSDAADSKSMTGGLRIYQIKNYDSYNASNPLTKTYYYVKDYDNQTAIEDLSSSGILSGIPDYYVKVGYDEGTDIVAAATTRYIFSSQSFTPLSINSNGSHIGYSEVVEVLPNNSYIIHNYTNYEDYDGTTHLDSRTEDKVLPEFSPYIPVDSKSLERGKFLRSDYFSSNDVLVKSLKQKYTSLGTSYVLGLDFNVMSSKCSNTTVYYHSSLPYKKYFYKYLKDELESTEYDVSGSSSITTLTNYDYNAYDLLSTVTYTRLNQNDVLRTSYKYPFDLLPESYMQDLIDNYQIGTIVQKETTKNSTAVGAEKTKYKIEHGHTVPSEVQISYSDAEEENLESKLFFDNYDARGNVREQHEVGNVPICYLWGYNKTYPVAKIENSSFQNAQNALSSIGSSTGDLETISLGSNDEVALIELFNNLREAPLMSGSQITSYTYDPLIGIRSMTDPNGITTYYVYDDLGRLKQTKDAEGNVLVDYTYQYKEEKIWGE